MSFHGASGEFIIAVLSPYPIHFLPPGAGLTMTPKLSVLLLLLLAVATVSVLAQRRRPTATTTDEWNYRDGCEHPDYSVYSGNSASSLCVNVGWTQIFWVKLNHAG